MNDTNRIQTGNQNRSGSSYSRRAPSYMPNSFPSGYSGNMKSSARQPEKHVERASSHQPTSEISSKPPEENRPEPESKSDERKPEEGQSGRFSDSGDIFKSFFEDKEKTLIILLIALLNEENADSPLLLALMYLII